MRTEDQIGKYREQQTVRRAFETIRRPGDRLLITYDCKRGHHEVLMRRGDFNVHWAFTSGDMEHRLYQFIEKTKWSFDRHAKAPPKLCETCGAPLMERPYGGWRPNSVGLACVHCDPRAFHPYAS